MKYKKDTRKRSEFLYDDESAMIKTGPWTEEEDMMVTRLVQINGP
jgi:hypothetical protein